MILSHKTSRELLDRAGKEQLADEILRDASRTMGIEVEEPEAIEDAPKAKDDAASGDDEKPRAKKKPRRPAEPNPIRHVHFANFIVQ
ncbi:MAG: flagellar basal body-associated FliL family protein, partial [Rhizobacter sp.]